MAQPPTNLQTALEKVRASTAGRSTSVTFLPEPERQRRDYTVISVDDHVVEPRHTFEGRLPGALQARAPHVVETGDGVEEWVYEDVRQPHMGLSAVVGRPPEEYRMEPARFDHMRRGTWDPDARIHDMDLNGVYASVNFPSALPGFAGQRLQIGHDPELAFAVVRAWNDWYLEEWVQRYPDRFVPLQLPWLLDPVAAAAEIRRNAERGFTAVAFTEGPHQLGLPSLHSGEWDPFLAACAETGTVVCLHVGSSSTVPQTSPDAPADVVSALFFGYAMFFTVDWLYSMAPVRFPDLRICLSEGGIGWVAGLLDRLDHMLRYHEMFGTWREELTPAEVVQRNFWFCALDDPSGFRNLERIGVDHVLVESDYPHLDSTWPDTQRLLREQLAGVPADAIERVTWANAAELFRHPVPGPVRDDPNRY